jgi:serine/threonine protein kinase
MPSRDTDREPTTAVSTTAPSAGEPAQRRSLPGYELGDLIGQGGMGEVRSAHDPDIGRDVAIKRLLAAAPTSEAIERFLREAKIQARLDHPAVVPVYELGRDTADRPYFTMKRLAGTTLHELLHTGRATQQRMLRAFVDVCLAIELAHARGVVHRDLKPANIMLGDYGEVYVLDWGIARVLGERAATAAAPGPDVAGLAGETAEGTMLGTLGYMAPEQVRGDADIGPPADVYSLGAILFEILAGESLHPLGHAAIASTLAGDEHVASQRAPHRVIPPELDAACTAALAASPSARPTARELADRIQHYLDGDRDLERRRALAGEHLARASELARDPDAQVEALRLAGRALALDPEGDAAALVTSLMLAPPRTAPPALQARLREIDLATSRRSARLAIYSLLAFFAFVPVILWSGFTAPVIGIAAYALIASLVLFIYRFGGAGGRQLFVTSVGFVLVGAFVTRVLGPFIVAPAILGIIAMALLAQPELMHRPVFVLTMLVAAFLGPIVLEAVGALEPTWTVAGESVVSRSAVIHLGGIPTHIILIVGNIATIVITGLFSRGMAASRREAQRRVEIHAWRLQQLVPVDTPSPLLISGPVPIG